ncbi:MAG: hypothetical protein GX677_07790 [Treponema sp.]|nr:hypothetical protein [Treponema sp.]
MKSKNKFLFISFFVLVSSLVMTTYSCKSGIDSNALLMIALINQQSAIKKGTTWKVSKTDTSKTITDVSGKKLYAVRYNSGSSALSTSDQKTITVYSGTRSLTSDDNNTNILPQNIENDDSRTYLSLPVYTPSSLGLNITEPSLLAKTVTPTPSYNNVGKTYSFYVDDATGGGSYASAQATVRYEGEHCTVWIIDRYYGSGDKQITSEEAESFGESFDKLYEYEPHITGTELNKLYQYTSDDSGVEVTITTNPKVNIVFFDIYSTSIMGYFWSRDYYDLNGKTPTGLDTDSINILSKSNKGKFLYIDSDYANSSKEDTYSTIVHEFQHMLNFSNRNTTQATFTEEMTAMLSEDMMSSKISELVPSFSKIEHSPYSRLSYLNKAYYTLSLNPAQGSPFGGECYAISYAFGAFLARNYGGALFEKNVVLNNYTAESSLEYATGESYDNLVQYFLESLVFQGKQDSHTLNKDAEQSITYNGYSYPMGKIDLWSSDFSNIVNYTTVNGPIIFSNATNVEIKPKGFIIHYLGEAESDSVTINFTSSSVDQTIFIMAQEQDNAPTTWGINS